MPETLDNISRNSTVDSRLLSPQPSSAAVVKSATYDWSDTAKSAIH
jgi:hypothetical protein